MTLADGKTRRILIAKAADKDSYAVSTTLRPELLRISSATATHLIDAAKLDTLIEPAPEAPAPEPSAPSGGNG